VKFEIKGDGWTAECLFTDNAGPDEFVHVQARIDGVSEASAFRGAETILILLGRGRLVVIRAEPEACTEKDFETQKIYYRGYVRFSYLAAGDERWQYADNMIVPIPFVGAES
jgi:hypothetical protein